MRPLNRPVRALQLPRRFARTHGCEPIGLIAGGYTWLQKGFSARLDYRAFLQHFNMGLWVLSNDINYFYDGTMDIVDTGFEC